MTKMRRGSPKRIQTPYQGINIPEYHIEKRRLQLELLLIQQDVVRNKRRVVILFDGRDAAGKGSTIDRFMENLMPAYSRLVALGVPTPSESKYWFKRYERHLPKQGEMVFFDRSWYNRALIEPTMGYCTEAQYKYYMRRVLSWEHSLIESGIELIKFYLSVDIDTQLYRFQERQSHPLKFWKFSENDLKARKKWEVFTKYKEQMFKRTSSVKSPWVTVSSNSKLEARLTSMLYAVEHLGNAHFRPLTQEKIIKQYSIKISGVPFTGLNARQYAVLKDISNEEKT